MNIITNDQLVRRNARIAQISIIAGFIILAAGMFISLRYPQLFNISLICLILGFGMTQVGFYFTNRWGRRPRPDELLNIALKGLDGKYALYHYRTPASHLLVGPSGVWVLLPKQQKGRITYSKGRWRQKGGGPFDFYLRIFAQEGIGRPDLEITGEVDALRNYLAKHLPEGSTVPEILAALVFTNPKVEIDIPEDETPPAGTITLKELKETIRKSAKGKVLSLDKVKTIQDIIEST